MADDYAQFRTVLEQERDRLRTELSKMSIDTEGSVGYGTHQADDASVAFEQAKELAVQQNAERLLYKVERALARMDEGSYGICRNCGKPIDPARLRAIPYTRYCMACANRNEQPDR
jgi:DnaK suppressor protein